MDTIKTKQCIICKNEIKTDKFEDVCSSACNNQKHMTLQAEKEREFLKSREFKESYVLKPFIKTHNLQTLRKETKTKPNDIYGWVSRHGFEIYGIKRIHECCISKLEFDYFRKKGDIIVLREKGGQNEQ